MRNAMFFFFFCFQLIAMLMVMLLWPIRLLRKALQSRDMCVSLWTGSPIICMGVNARAERLLGVHARSLAVNTYYVTDAFDYVLSFWSKIPVLGYLVPLFVFCFICLGVDRLHLYCNGLLPGRKRFSFNAAELFWYHLFGIELFCWTYGADVRSRALTQALGEPNCCTECTKIGQACICDDAVRARNMQRIRKYAKAIFSMGDMIEYTPGSNNNLFFWPIDLYGADADKYSPVYPQVDPSRPIRIVHATNHRMFKGTHFLVEAVAQLQKEGVSLELVLVEKVSNVQALEIYRSADIIFDQCLIGFHGYFALEGMAMGKPVMCFIRKPKEYLLHPECCPLIYTSVSTLKDDIKALCQDRTRLTEMGIRSRRYIEEYYTLEAFAQRLKQAYAEA